MKKLIALLLAVLTALVITGCSSEREPEPPGWDAPERFKVVAQYYGGRQLVYVDTETGVLYICVNPSGTVYRAWGSVLVDTDGKPMLAEGYTRESED